MSTLELKTVTTAALPDRGAEASESTLGAEIRRRARLQPEHPAVVASGFSPLTYRQLDELIAGVRSSLRTAGLGRDARIAIAMPNGPQAALAIASVSCAAVSVPLNPQQTVREIENHFDALRPDALLIIKGRQSNALAAATARGVPVFEAVQSPDGGLGFAIDAPSPAVGLPDESGDPHPEAPAFILQTSGTAAEPKLIPFSHRNMLAAAVRVQNWFDLSPQDRCLSASPLFYSHGLKVTVFTPLLTGGTIAFPTDSSKFDYSEWLVSLKPTWYSAGPTLHQLILEQSSGAVVAARPHSLRFILSGGAPLPQKVREGLERLFDVPVVEHYGSSEAAQISANLPRPGRSKPGTCGIPSPHTIMIVDDDGRPVPSGEKGEVLVGGPTVTSGYLNAPELNQASFVDGWLRSGDIGSLDADGFLTLHGRKSDAINRGGEKISPVEVDEALMRHPAVAEAAAFAVPHQRLGSDIAAAVVLRPGATATAIELRKFLQDQVAPFKIPRRIAILNALPKGKTGKILRRQLSESFERSSTTPAPATAAPSPTAEATADEALVASLIRIWERLLKVSPILPDDDFFEKGGDSLLATQMLAELDLLTGKRVPAAILFEANTVRQLARKLLQRGDLSEGLAHLNPDGRRTPVFFFHGDFNGRGYSVVKLAAVLGSDVPLFVVGPHGTGDEKIPDTVEAMAADRLSLILSAQPEGPYRLIGNCLGGIVAFEVARLLIASGKKVEFLVLMDPPTVSALRSVKMLMSAIRFARPLAGRRTEGAMVWAWLTCANLQKFFNVSWSRRIAAVGKLATGRIRHATLNRPEEAAAAGRGAERSPFEQTGSDRSARYALAMANYFPKPLSVRVLYFAVDYDGEVWRRLSPDLKIVKLSGHHFGYDFVDMAPHLQAWVAI